MIQRYPSQVTQDLRWTLLTCVHYALAPPLSRDLLQHEILGCGCLCRTEHCKAILLHPTAAPSLSLVADYIGQWHMAHEHTVPYAQVSLSFTDVYIQGCFVTCDPHIVFCSSTEGLNTLLWHWVKPTRSSNIFPEGIFLTLLSQYLQVTAVYDCTAGCCCLFGAMVRGDLPIFQDPMHCWAKGPGVQHHCESIQLTISGTTLRCQWACHQFLLNALACSLFWSPPDVVHHWGCRLASLHWFQWHAVNFLWKPWSHMTDIQLRFGNSIPRLSKSISGFTTSNKIYLHRSFPI